MKAGGRGTRRLSTKLVVTQIVFLLVALGSIGTTLLVSWKLEGSAAAINDAGSLRMRAWRLAYLASSADAAGAARDEILRSVESFADVLATLRRGDPARPLFVPRTAAVNLQFDALERAWTHLDARLQGAAHGGVPPERADVERFVAQVNGLVATIEEDISRTTAILRNAQLALVPLAIAGTVALMYLSFLLVIRPLTRLHEGIDAMAAGDLAVRVSVENDDEFGQVTAGFNAMAARLEGAYRELEQRVEEKTRTLAERTARLQTLYDMAAFLNGAQSRQAMAEGFAARVQHAFAADAAAVRVLGQDGTLHLLASRNLAPAIAAEEQCLAAGTCACGQAAGRAATVLHRLDGVALAGELPHCRTAGYRAVIATPVEAHGGALGMFNLFFRAPRELTLDEQHLLGTLGQHLGVALETMRLTALEREMAVSEERNLLAQELHDSIAQSLAFLNLQVQLLEGAMKEGDEARARTTVAELRAGVQECYGDVRELLTHFRTRLAPEDLRHALAAMLHKFERSTGIETSMSARGAGMPLSPERQLQALHVVQEALSNARKHASCSRVDVALEVGPEYRIRVQDDGCGFDPAAAAADDHVGLSIMRERAHRAGGHVSIASAPGAGTQVILTLPVAEAAVAAPA